MGEDEVIEAVVEILRRELTELSDSEMSKCLSIWRDFSSKREVGRSRKPETWAAAVYYLFMDQSQVSCDRVTLEEAAERFGVSKSSVQRRQREILELMTVGFLEGRYSPGESSKRMAETGHPDEPSAVPERLTEEVEKDLYDQFDAVRSDLFRFAIEEFRDEVPDAEEEFEETRRPRQTDVAFADWFTLDRESSRGETPLETYLRERADIVPSEVLDWVRLWGETEDALYSVREVDAETGKLTLANPMTGEFREAVDYSAAAKLEPGLMIVTRLFPWPDTLHLSGDLEVFSVGLVPVSARDVIEETGIDPWEVPLTPLIIIPANLERVRLMKEGLSETVAFMTALEKIGPAAVKLEAGDESQFLPILDRYSQVIRMSLDRFGLDIDPSEQIDEFNKPLPKDKAKSWSEIGQRLSKSLERPEFIATGALSLLLAKARALEGERELRQEDFQWAEDRILENRALLDDVIKSL
ncbi:hypothetical protein AKJ61_00185 [candidate division MSBL1 archaeon SCGC-AAA259B11]|uniref:Uncharacterized protein n=1 Tax=candidate division MSBL1 archaeon SCGC-AAA259B11 TaxID=1698260 RepID=A0A133U915_9EURY|nr:hypothetical protein AKJ61_00185 [candidate division MSBL1 archaeon SCGC-AAA259B11]